MVVLVDRNDRAIGTAPKMEAHEKGLLHRAVSVLLFNGRGELLIQRRAAGKYHSGSLWANTCCGHPLAGESCIEAAGRRLWEEMGLSASLTHAGTLLYRARLVGGMQEHEVDHLFIGRSDEAPQPDPKEVSDFRYTDLAAIGEEVARHPERFAIWFRIILSRFGAALMPTIR